MKPLYKYFISVTILLLIISYVSSDTYTVKISTETHVNDVDARFLSFTVDPKYLFSNNDQYNSQECLCMAAALTPAYIRIAGPSTQHMTFENSTITIHPDLGHDSTNLQVEDWTIHKHFPRRTNPKKRSSVHPLTVSNSQWKKFAEWANKTGFDIVFALNSHEKMQSGMWDPNSALSILSLADSADIGDIVWQLGYECWNQSIEEYLYDLETLRVMVETFPRETRRWLVVGGDVSPCLHADSRSDFKDFITLSNERLDAILLDGNSSSWELERMSERDRMKLLRLLSHSDTPLWITDQRRQNLDNTELQRAAEWLSSLGQSARNGFAVHFRELNEDELFLPSMSFYMALLFKNLVGERVLSVEFDTETDRTTLFAHCTSLRHKPVTGAVTIFGTNMGEEPARFSLKLAKREEGGDIMQFILGQDSSGNIVINGRTMYYEGDIRPVVKRVRPYRTLLMNLPAKSFGFWVLANTKIDACYDVKSTENIAKTLVKAISVTDYDPNQSEETNFIRTKRFNTKKQIAVDDTDVINVSEEVDKNYVIKTGDSLGQRINNINYDLKNMHKKLEANKKRATISRRKREAVSSEINEKINKIKKFKRPFLTLKEKKSLKLPKSYETKPKVSLVSRLLQLNNKLNKTRLLKNDRTKKLSNLGINKQNKRNIDKTTHQELDEELYNAEQSSRVRRSIFKVTDKKLFDESTSENEIDYDGKDFIKFGKILQKINKQVQDLPRKIQDAGKINSEENSSGGIEDQLIVKTKITDDDASIKLSEKSSNGMLKSTFNTVFTMLDDLKDNMNKIIHVLNLLH